MFHVVQILLYRPFVSYGHLQSVLPEEFAKESFGRCGVAANCIAQYLESYNRVHSFQFAPFFLFYASYVSATIHVRIAAQRQLTSGAFESLQMCLSVFDQNELNNPAVKKAKAIIIKMMARMGVQAPGRMSQTSVATSSKEKTRTSASKKSKSGTPNKAKNLATPVSTPQKMDFLEDWTVNVNDIDFDAILQSFRPNAGAVGPLGTDNSYAAAPQMMSNAWSAPDTSQLGTNDYTYMNQFGGGFMDDNGFAIGNENRINDWLNQYNNYWMCY